MELVVILGLMMFSVDKAEFIKAVDSNREKGYNWEYVGKHEVQNEDLAVPLETPDGQKIYYWYLGESDGTK